MMNPLAWYTVPMPSQPNLLLLFNPRLERLQVMRVQEYVAQVVRQCISR